MFERYTEAARKSIFFARYQADVANSPEIEPVHVLIGVFHADGDLALRILGSPQKVDLVRQRLIAPPVQPGLPVTVDLPLSQECKRALAYAAEEMERQNHAHLGTAHLLVGLVREPDTPASALLMDMGVTLEKLRREAVRSGQPDSRAVSTKRGELAALLAGIRRGQAELSLPDHSVDLTAAAAAEKLDPLIGRDGEIERILEILLRRFRHSVALTGEAGVGKTALVAGLAQRLLDGAAHPVLGGRTVRSIDARLLGESGNPCEGSVILCVEGLFDLPPDEAVAVVGVVQSQAHHHDARLIATGSPDGFRSMPAALSRQFEVVELLPPTEAETVRILTGLKERYEKFHEVAITDDAIQAAVVLSRRYRSRRLLPDRALDLLDGACTAVRLKAGQEVKREHVAAQLAA